MSNQSNCLVRFDVQVEFAPEYRRIGSCRIGEGNIFKLDITLYIVWFDTLEIRIDTWLTVQDFEDCDGGDLGFDKGFCEDLYKETRG